MSSSTVDTQILKEFSDNSIHDMFVIANNIEKYEKSLELLKELCLKLEKYNDTKILISETQKDPNHRWKITGNKELLASIEKIELSLSELNTNMEQLDPIISNIDTTKDDLKDQIKKIEETLSSGIIIEKKNDIINNFNNDSIVINKTDVINSIDQNFINNRNLTNNFNQELYNRINKEISNLASNKGN